MGLNHPRSLWMTLRFGIVYAVSGGIVWAARLWQAFWAVICLAAVFAALAALDTFGGISQAWHYAALAPFAAGLVWAVSHGLARFRRPTRGQIEHAMEKSAGIAHRPLQALRDKTVGTRAPDTAALWQEHQQRMQAARDHVRIARFNTTVAEEDRYYLRYAAPLFLIAALALTGADAPQRVTAAVQPGWPALGRAAPPALDIWITPPAYTQAAPVYLARAQNTSAKLSTSATVPAGSILKIRLSGQHRAPLVRYGRDRMETLAVSDRSFTAEFPLDESAPLVLRHGLRALGRWDITVTPDQPPKAGIVSTQPAANGALKITWQAGDDYGVIKATAVLDAPTDMRRGLLTGADAVSVIDLPPPSPPAAGQPQDTVSSYQADLSGHPLAGSGMSMYITATDAAGNTTKSAPVEVTLPERVFESPVAQRLIVERKRLLFYGDTPFAPPLTGQVLLDIVNQPQMYRGDRIVFLALASAVRRISYDGDAESLRSVADLLWDVALRVEDGGVSEAARDLQNALSALSSALNDPAATKEQIQELLGDVQERLQEYMEALSAEMQQRQQAEGAQGMPPEIAEKVMQKIDMQEFMQRLRDMAQGDKRDGLRKMTEMLRDMMGNMDMKAMARMQQAQQQAMEALQKLEDVVRGQQELIEAGNSGGSDGEGSPSAHDMQEMAGAQDNLARQLDALRQGLGPLAGRMNENLDTAARHMADASAQLRAGQPAADAQRAALKALTDAQDQAMQQLAEAMQNMMMLGMGGGQQPGGSGEGYDPLGRAKDGGKNIGGEIGIPSEGERRRVQEIQRELRERHQDGNRTRTERDYIERLLDLFR